MIKIDGNHLTLEACERIGRLHENVVLSPKGIEQIQISNQRLNKIISYGKPVYGINTGFGFFSDKKINPADISTLNRNLILSHAVGTGRPLDKEVVRVAMLIRANTLSKGFSGIRCELVSTLIEMINKDVIPVIPSQGSLGSSGDLCQLSQLALVLSRDERDLDEESGKVIYKDQLLSGKTAMKKAGIKRIILGPKEGLALNNGATFSTAIASMAVLDAEKLILLSVLSLALTLEALRGRSNAFDPRIHDVRNFKGQILYAKMVNKLIHGSKWVDSSDRVQDAYSLRCAPQVCGSVIDTIGFVKSILKNEINAATDNPLIFEPDQAISGGNFHGEPVGLAMDYLKIALSELSAISERRTYRLLDHNLNDGLPAMLVDNSSAAGLNSGLMMPHYTAVSLTLENQHLANPDSTRSLPASGSQEDHNANSMTAARHAREVVKNVIHVLAVEIHTACQAISIRQFTGGNLFLGQGTKIFYEIIRSEIPFKSGDRLWGIEIEKIIEVISCNEFSALLKKTLR
jgi:histidine ammonia-lyase